MAVVCRVSRPPGNHIESCPCSEGLRYSRGASMPKPSYFRKLDQAGESLCDVCVGGGMFVRLMSGFSIQTPIWPISYSHLPLIVELFQSCTESLFVSLFITCLGFVVSP